MQNGFKRFIPIWAVLLVVFNLIVFLVRPLLPGYEIHYDGRFWVIWVFIILAFLGNLFCTYKAFQAENAQKMFYNLPLITISWSGLIAIMVIGSVMMLIPDFPAWIAAVVCVLIVALHAIAIAKASWAAEAVERVDEKVKNQTSFIRNMTAEAQGLIDRAKSEEARAECKKVYEALRYSDPVSNDALADVEGQIELGFNELSNAVTSCNEDVGPIANKLVLAIDDRNRKCKALK